MISLQKLTQILMGLPSPVVMFMAKIGYGGTGVGGTVAQLTDKTTAVTLNKMTGQVTMQAANLAAGTIVSHTLTNSFIEANDLVVVQHFSGGTPGSYSFAAIPAAGSAVVNVRNNSAGGLAEAIVYNFFVLKAVAA